VLGDLATVAAPLGNVREHVFFGARKTFYTESDIDDVSLTALAITRAIDEFLTTSRAVATEFGLSVVTRLSELLEVGRLRDLLRSSPGAPVDVLLDVGWNSPPAAATRLVLEGRELCRLIDRTERLFTTAAFDQRHADDVAYIERKTAGLFGFLAILDARYRAIKRRWVSYRKAFVGNVLDQANEL